MKNLLKILFSVLLVSVMAFGLTACGGEGTPDDNGDNPTPPAHTCSFVASEWFDASADKVFVKKETCTCGQSKTKSALEITTADQFIKWASYVNNDEHYATDILIANDIDLAGKTYEPIILNYQSAKAHYIIKGAEGGVSIKNLTVADADYAGLFGSIECEVEIKNIVVKNANISGDYAGGFIGYIYNAGSVKVADCGVENSTINGATAAGGMFGVAEADQDTQVFFYTPVVKNNQINSEEYAGGFAGIMTECEGSSDSAYKVLAVEVFEGSDSTSSWTVVGNVSSSTSSKNNVVGTLFGKVGNGRVKVPLFNLDFLAGNTAFLNGTAVGREYGRTGWANKATEGLYMNGLAMIHYDGNNVVNGD